MSTRWPHVDPRRDDRFDSLAVRLWRERHRAFEWCLAHFAPLLFVALWLAIAGRPLAGFTFVVIAVAALAVRHGVRWINRRDDPQFARQPRDDL